MAIVPPNRPTASPPSPADIERISNLVWQLAVEALDNLDVKNLSASEACAVAESALRLHALKGRPERPSLPPAQPRTPPA